jgi:succinate dehydrogenase/fumarate reductase flavoprotein subunit
MRDEVDLIVIGAGMAGMKAIGALALHLRPTPGEAATSAVETSRPR